MTVVPEQELRDELSAVLTAAGWTVRDARDADEGLELCRSLEADVLMVDDRVPGGASSLLERMNTGAERVTAGVVVLGESLDIDAVVSAMEQGAADILRTPVDPAETIARATAAARTKALVKELTTENHRIEGLVMFDELTGLRNRRAVLLELETMVAGARRHGRDLSAVMVDVDHFKLINDTHGHRAGDAVLREVAARIGDRLRCADVAGRLGGDEILILLPETESKGAGTLADAIRRTVTASSVNTPAGPIDVTISVGAAAWEGESAEHLIDRADKALYAAKAAGRDRSVAL